MRPGTQSMPVGDVAPELALLVGAVAALIYALFAPRRRQGAAAAIALLALVISAALAARLAGGPQHLSFGDSYAIDTPAAAVRLIVLGSTALVLLLSLEWFRADPRQGEYYSLLLFSALGAMLLGGVADLMGVILGVLLSSATGYVLAAYHRRSRRSAEAAMKYFLLGALTNAGMLYGSVLLFGLASTTIFVGMAREPLGPGLALPIGTALMLLGLLFKMGAVPAHAWMPDVADGAPAPVSAFLTLVPKVGALVAIARLLSVLPEAGLAWRPLVAAIAAATMTLGNLAALRQDDVRRLLGWSAVSQSGYALMGVVALGRSPLAIPAILYFLVAYALANVAAFGVVIELRGRTARADYAGLAHGRPLLALALVVAFLSFVGIPPLAGFTAKLTLFGATMQAGYTWLAALAVGNSVVSLAYYARVLAPAYFAPTGDAETVPVLGGWAALATGLAAAGVIVTGIFAQGILGNVFPAVLLPR